MITELKPCPFCGTSDPVLFYCDDEAFDIICVKCKVGTPIYNNKKEAIDTWNKRAITASNDLHFPIARCIKCNRPVDTREVDEGGDEHGCQLEDGRWTCSPDCYYMITFKLTYTDKLRAAIIALPILIKRDPDDAYGVNDVDYIPRKEVLALIDRIALHDGQDDVCEYQGYEYDY